MPQDQIWGPNGVPASINKDVPHFASRDRAGLWLDLIWNVLPDPDPILARAGKSYSGLRELLLDEQVETAWTSRLAAMERTPWDIVPGSADRASRKTADFCREVYSGFNMDTINRGLIEHVLYGFAPAELLWCSVEGKWIPLDIVPKPPEWFAWSGENRLVMKTRTGGPIELPENRFICLQNRPTFTNPYGEKLLSKIFWSVTFRRNGARWWAIFTEKFGGAFATAKYRPGAPEEEQAEILAMLEDLVTCGVAVFPEGTTVDISTDSNKSAATGNFSEFEGFFNANISKVILGATLTTDIGDKGSYSAAQVHNDVRNDIALSDRKAIAEAHNEVLRLISSFNFGSGDTPPIFAWEEPEDLKVATVERDSKLYQLGWRPTKEYITDTYGIADDHFTLADSAQALAAGFSAHGEGPRQKALARFSDAKDDADIDGFMQTQFRKGQRVVNAVFESYSNAAKKASTYDEAFALMLKRFPSQLKHRRRGASIIDNVRYAASQLGAAEEAKRED